MDKVLLANKSKGINSEIWIHSVSDHSLPRTPAEYTSILEGVPKYLKEHLVNSIEEAQKDSLDLAEEFDECISKLGNPKYILVVIK